MSFSTRFSCRCGQVTGTLSVARPGQGMRVICHCNSCRTVMERAGMDAADGVDIFQTTPDRITIDTGLDQLQPRQRSKKGIYRWHAKCCDTPMMNTLQSPAMPFVGVLVANLEDDEPLGPVAARGFIDAGGGKQRHENGLAVMWGFLTRAAWARLTGRGRQTPLFNSDGSPIAAAEPLGRGPG